METTRDLPAWAVWIEPPAGERSQVRHVTYESADSRTFGRWYALCGRIVPGWQYRELDPEDTALRPCAACAAKLARNRRTRRVIREVVR